VESGEAGFGGEVEEDGAGGGKGDREGAAGEGARVEGALHGDGEGGDVEEEG
jgi:hypothetical protein